MPTYSTMQLPCKGRACYQCGKCREWYFSRDVATWDWIRNWPNWNETDKQRWKDNKLGNLFQRRNGCTCTDSNHGISSYNHLCLAGANDSNGCTHHMCICEDNSMC